MTFQSFFCELGLNDIDEWSAFSSSKVVPSIVQPRATGHKIRLKANACSATNRVKIIEHGRTLKGPILELRISCLAPNQDPAYFPPAPSPPSPLHGLSSNSFDQFLLPFFLSSASSHTPSPLQPKSPLPSKHQRAAQSILMSSSSEHAHCSPSDERTKAYRRELLQGASQVLRLFMGV